MIRELLAAAARAALQWALASLLLANGAAFCAIAAAAARLRLGPPCLLCARVHRLLRASSSGGGHDRDALRLLLCDAHLAAVAARPAAPDRGNADGVPEREDGLEADDQDKVSGLETHRVVSIGSEICERDHGDDEPGSAERGSGSGPLVSLFELSPIVTHPRDADDGDDHSQRNAAPPDLLNADGGERLTVGQLLSLRSQRRELDALRAELAAERRARTEAEEHQRQLEEQGELDREAARLAMRLVHETETEKHGLQRQLDACRVRAQLYESGSATTGDAAGNGDNYQSLVDFLPGSVYSSSPDLANLLKLYTEPGNGDRRRRDGYASAVTVVAEEAEDEDVAVAVRDGPESVVYTTAIVGDSLHETSTSCHTEAETEAG